VIFKAAVEGYLDEVVLQAMASPIGVALEPVYGKKGKQDLRNKVSNYNRAAQFEPWIILVDLNTDAQCAPELCRSWVAEPSPLLCFRVAVRAVESWLLADRVSIAKFLGVSKSLIPGSPDSLEDPKETLVNLARRSRRTRIREDLVPSPTGGRKVGPAYNSSLIEFVIHSEIGWRPLIAAEHSESLRRCMEAVRRFKRPQ
jgi:hypothetical protein